MEMEWKGVDKEVGIAVMRMRWSPDSPWIYEVWKIKGRGLTGVQVTNWVAKLRSEFDQHAHKHKTGQESERNDWSKQPHAWLEVRQA